MKGYELSQILVQDAMMPAVEAFGIEGAEQKIKELYWFNPKLKMAMLNAWQEKYGRSRK